MSLDGIPLQHSSSMSKIDLPMEIKAQEAQKDYNKPLSSNSFLQRASQNASAKKTIGKPQKTQAQEVQTQEAKRPQKAQAQKTNNQGINKAQDIEKKEVKTSILKKILTNKYFLGAVGIACIVGGCFCPPLLGGALAIGLIALGSVLALPLALKLGNLAYKGACKVLSSSGQEDPAERNKMDNYYSGTGPSTYTPSKTPEDEANDRRLEKEKKAKEQAISEDREENIAGHFKPTRSLDEQEESDLLRQQQEDKIAQQAQLNDKENQIAEHPKPIQQGFGLNREGELDYLQGLAKQKKGEQDKLKDTENNKAGHFPPSPSKTVEEEMDDFRASHEGPISKTKMKKLKKKFNRQRRKEIAKRQKEISKKYSPTTNGSIHTIKEEPKENVQDQQILKKHIQSDRSPLSSKTGVLPTIEEEGNIEEGQILKRHIQSPNSEEEDIRPNSNTGPLTEIVEDPEE